MSARKTRSGVTRRNGFESEPCPLCTGLWDIGHLRCNSHMRNVLLLSFIFAGALTLAAQTPSTGTTPAKQAPATGTAAPAKPAPATGTAAATKPAPAPAPAATAAAPAKPAQTTDAAATAKQTTTTGTGTAKPRATSGTRATVPAPAGRSGVALRVTDMSGRNALWRAGRTDGTDDAPG